MYLFYFDESGNRNPAPRTTERGGVVIQDNVYVLTAVSLFERDWPAFDQELSDLKLQLRSKLYRQKGISLDTLADCEVKSTALRVPRVPGKKGYSPFVHNLDDADKTLLAELFLSQLEKHRMRIFSVVIDKRRLHDHMDPEKMHKKAYELVLERIQQYLREYHRKHSGIIVMDDTQKQLNQSVAMKHAFFQREGNRNMRFRNILEYPFFTDSRLSNGIQLADLCCYNVYRVFRSEQFDYPWFQRMLPFFYHSNQSREERMDGLKVFPPESDLVSFAQDGIDDFRALESETPAEEGGRS
jgi:hypothetical protein